MKKEKPKMGTKLIPSIENIEGCYKWGGKWDYKNKFCYREDENGGCTAPYKGIEYCWGVYSYETSEYDQNDNEYIEEKHRPEVWGSIVDADEQGVFYNPFYGGYYEDNPWELDHDTKEDAMATAKEEAITGFTTGRFGPCFNMRGKLVDCKNPDAIACSDPDVIIDYFQSRMFREKPLIERKKPHKLSRYDTFYKPESIKPYQQTRFDINKRYKRGF